MAKVAAPVDLKTQATWSVSLGDSITATKKAPRLTSIRYNYQPRLDKSIAQREVKPAAGRKVTGVIKEKEQEWQYVGTQDEGMSDSYVLVLRNDGKNEATLEKLDTMALNISSTPIEKDVSKLKERYRQLSVSVQDGEEDDSTPDDSNPFDYRHFLEDSPKVEPVAKSSAATPVHRPAASTPTVAAKRKPEVKPATSKRAKTETATKTKKTATKIPEVRLERKASMRPPVHDDDDGELILENEDDAPSRHLGGGRQSAMSMALNGNLGGGRPISLHSAASSPIGFHSPAPDRPRHEDEEIDLENAMDVDDDGDIEDFDLPSPVRTMSKAQGQPVDEDDDDDWNRALAEAMDDDGPAAQPAQEEEESEEE